MPVGRPAAAALAIVLFAVTLGGMYATSAAAEPATTVLSQRTPEGEPLGMIGRPPPEVVSDASPAGLTKPSQPAATQKAESPAATASEGPDSNLHKLIERIAEEYGLDPYLVKGLVRVESNFNCKAKSRAGACGLMQLMPGTARRLGVDDIFDPADNLRGGVKYLSRLIDRFGNIRAALAAYLRGPKAVLKHGGVPHDSVTRKFIRRVLGYRDAYLDESPREQVFAETPAPGEVKRP